MRHQAAPLTPEHWLNDLFTSKLVRQGLVFRRKARDVERYCGMDMFMAEINRRGFQVYENAGELVVICNQEPLRRLTPPRPLSYNESDPKSYKDFEAGVAKNDNRMRDSAGESKNSFRPS